MNRRLLLQFLSLWLCCLSPALCCLNMICSLFTQLYYILTYDQTCCICNTLPCPHIPHGIHVEQIYSMWNPWNLHGIHMESTWNMFHHMESTWTYSTWNPHGIHLKSMWNAPNISTYSQVRLKKLISLIS